MRAQLLVQVDGLPDGSDQDLAEGFDDLLRELAKAIGTNFPCTVAIKAVVGKTVKEAVLRVTPKKPVPPGKVRGGPRPVLPAEPARRVPTGEAMFGRIRSRAGALDREQ